MQQSFKLFTLGCKVNQYETQAIREQLLNAGYRDNTNEIADIYIVNTCTVTSRADRESLRLIRKLLDANPQSKIVATGCLVEKDTQEILEISDKIKIVPNQQKHHIATVLNQAPNAQRPTHNETFTPLRISAFKDHQRAFVKIQDGCNNFCSYCKVPLVRGRSRSRPLSEIVEEVRCLLDCGFKEIVLTGICLGNYHYKNFDLSNVLLALEKIKGSFRLRLSSIEPQLIDDRLIEILSSFSRICAHLHIPLQSADDTILKKMNRRYTQEDYLSLVTRTKKKVKDIAITTDILLGFPGEKKANFQNTLQCLKQFLPLRTHIFSFSPRKYTKAFDLPERIEPRLIKERVDLAKEVAQECSYKFRKRFLQKELTVLVESRPAKEAGSLCGYSENYIRINVDDATKEDINKLLKVKIEAVDMCFTRAKRLGRGVASF